MRAVAEELAEYADRLDGSWRVEIGAAGPVLAMTHRPNRYHGTIHRIREQLDEQLPSTDPGHICANGPWIDHAAIGRMRLPGAAVIPEACLDEEGLAVDATQVRAAIEVVSPLDPDNDYRDKLADYPAMGIPHYLIVDPRTGTIEVHSEPCGDRYRSKESYIYGDKVPFGPWTVETRDFRRYGKAGNDAG